MSSDADGYDFTLGEQGKKLEITSFKRLNLKNI